MRVNKCNCYYITIFFPLTRLELNIRNSAKTCQATLTLNGIEMDIFIILVRLVHTTDTQSMPYKDTSDSSYITMTGWMAEYLARMSCRFYVNMNIKIESLRSSQR